MIELFAMLNPKSINLNGSSSSSLIENTDLCGILASLDEIHSWYIYSMIEQRRTYNMSLLHAHFKQVVLQEMLARRFKSKLLKPSEFAEGVTKAAIYAHFHHKGKCGACSGLGLIGRSKCKKCDGGGSKEYSHSEKVNYAFPMRTDVSRKWYQKSCVHYDQIIVSELYEIRQDLLRSLAKVKSQALQYRRDEVNEALFDEF